MSHNIQAIAIYGAGSWGTALAIQLSYNGLHVLLWDRSEKRIEQLKCSKQDAYLADVSLPSEIILTNNLEEAALFSKNHLVVVATLGIRDLLKQLQCLWQDSINQQRIICASKGIEENTGYLMHRIFAEALSPTIPYAMLSGPTFAREVAIGLPTALTIASSDSLFAKELVEVFTARNIRAYTSNDVIGVELLGSLKNVLAIAAGISDGLGFGSNARAALITRGLAEIARIAKHMGAKDHTMMGLAGLGDLVLTCTDDQSRNRRLGLAIGQGKSLAETLQVIGQAVEGVKTARSVHQLSQKMHIEMPICNEVYQILFKGQSPKTAVKKLLSRKVKEEY